MGSDIELDSNALAAAEDAFERNDGRYLESHDFTHALRLAIRAYLAALPASRLEAISEAEPAMWVPARVLQTVQYRGVTAIAASNSQNDVTDTPLYVHTPPAGHVAVPVEHGLDEAFTALDLADSLIARAYGIDVPAEWNNAYAKVAEARSALPNKVEPTRAEQAKNEVLAADYTHGHCEYNKPPSGCPLHNLQYRWPHPLHNLQYRWPDCDRRRIPPAQSGDHQ